MTHTVDDWWNDVDISPKPLRIMRDSEWKAIPATQRVRHNGETYVARTTLDPVMIVPDND